MSDRCPHCGTTAKHGERISCCSGCGRLFTSGSAFDKHQRNLTCVDPATVGLVLRPIRQAGVRAEGWGFPASDADWTEKLA